MRPTSSSQSPVRSTAGRTFALLSAVLAAALVAAACRDDGETSKSTRVPQPTRAQLEASGLAKLPLAPDSQRVDLATPPFSHPTEVTNPLFPIGKLHSAVLNGVIDGKPFHTETTLLPYTRALEWPAGHQVEALVSQYAAFLDGRIQEVALDYYAQADDGSVWYFGEDVFDYNEDGLIAFTTDSWLTGQDGPPAMIMPAHPKVGQAFRTENIPGLVFEQVTVKTVGKTVPGPSGPVDGVMVGEELHDDGMTSDKVFAPGYGEFLTRDQDGVEAMALAVPTDVLDGPPPAELEGISKAADDALDAVSSADWKGASAATDAMTAAWDGYPKAGRVPPRLQPPVNAAIEALSKTILARDQQSAQTAAIDVAQAALDIELRYQSPDEIDLARFELWTRQTVADTAAERLGAVSGDVASLEWTRDRIADRLDPADLSQINSELLALREAEFDKDLAAVSEAAGRVRATAARLKLVR
jgi:hypothetical protein